MSHEDYTSVPALFKTFLTLIAAIGIIVALFYTATTSNFWSSEAATTTIAGTLPTPNSTLEDGLVGHWSFDGSTISGTTVTDLSGQGNNGTLTNGPQVVAGQVGQGMSFDGVDDYVNLGTSTPYQFADTTFTVIGWFKSSPGVNGGVFVAQGGEIGAGGWFVGLNGTTAGQLTAVLKNTDGGQTGRFSNTGGFNDNQWHQFAFIVTTNTSTHTNNEALIYVDGRQLSTGVSSDSTTGAYGISNATAKLGTRGGASDAFYSGELDDTRIYNRALTPDEVSQLYQHGKPDKINHADSQDNFFDPLTTGLLGYWNLDETSGTTVTDWSGYNNNTGTTTNGPTWTTGQIAGAVNLDGIDDYINVGTPSSLDLTNTFTLSAWIYPEGYGGGGKGRIFDKVGNSVTSGYFFALDNSNITAGFGYGNHSGYTVESANTIDLNTWQHVAVTLDSNQVATLYKNGVSVLAESDAFPASSGNNFVIGGRTIDNARNFDGIIDEARVYNRALSAAEIALLYQETTPRITTPEELNLDPVGHWSFDGPTISGTTVIDQSGRGNNGTLTNGPQVVAGQIGQGMSFDGVNDYVDTNNDSSLNDLTELTYAAWVNTASTSGFILSKNSNGGGSTGFLISGGVLQGWVANFTGWYAGRATSISIIPLNEWSHVVMTYSNSGDRKPRLYINGVEVVYSEQDTADGADLDNAATFWIGRKNGANEISDVPFTGSMDDLRIYNRALSAAEVTTLYTRSKGVLVQSAYPSWAPYRCGIETVQDADGNVYDTILIGSQCWMKQNMRVGTRVNISTTQTNNATIEKWCYNDSSADCTTNHPNQPDGGLYQWNEAMQYSTTPGAQGICPTGWHIPTHDEFTTMELAICTTGSCATDFPYDTTTTGERGVTEGTKLKANGTSGLEFNLTGYSIVSSYLQGVVGAFWSSSESAADAWNRSVNSGTAKVLRGKDSKSVGWAVRCLKD